jgi:inosine-uridine nucleoside N-ribohydrolase
MKGAWVLLLLAIAHSVWSVKVIIDSDTTMLLRFGDVDDDLAILWTLASPELDLLGVTSTFGNSVTQRTFHDAKELLRKAGNPTVAHEGANYFKRDLSAPTNASQFLITAITSSPEPVTVICIGAPTNLAAALTQEPSIAKNIERIILNGGDPENPPFQELFPTSINYYFDIHAAKFLFDAPIPKVILPIQVMLQSVFTITQINELSQVGHPYAK